MDWENLIEPIDGEVHREFLRMTYSYAKEFSQDKTTNTGATIIDQFIIPGEIDIPGRIDELLRLDYQIISRGANRFRDGVNPTEAQLKDRDWKYKNIIHAEVSAIRSAERPVGGAIMYMPWVPCTPCANEMVEAGLDTWIGHRQLIEKTPDRWIKSCSEAIEVLKGSDMKFYMFDGEIGGIKNLFDGLIWYP